MYNRLFVDNKTTYYVANIYTAQRNEDINSVGFFTVDAQEDYEVYVYTDVDEDPTDGATLKAHFTGSELYSGFHKAYLKEPIRVNEGDKFSVIVETKNSGSFYVDKTKTSSSWATVNYALEGESFFSTRLGSWQDLGEDGYTGRVKVYTTPEKIYNINYHLDGGTNNEDNPKTFKDSDEPITLLDPTKENYVFDGWYSDSDLTKSITVIDPKDYSNDVDVYAKWALPKEPRLVTVCATPNAVATGQGQYYEGDEVTVIATSRVLGYTFDGWYLCDEGEKTGSKLSDNETYVFEMPDEDVSLIAVYIPPSSFSLEVEGSNFSVNGQKYTGSYSDSYPSLSEIEIVYDDEDNDFAYWTNSSNKVLSKNKTYKFIISSNTKIEAVSIDESVTKYIFTSSFGQIMKMAAIEKEMITSSTTPILPGSTFIAWKIRGTNEEIDLDNIDTGIREYAVGNPSTKLIYLDPVYEKLEGVSTLTIKYVGVDKTDLINTYDAEGPYSLYAQDTIDGKKFSYWKYGNDIIGYTTYLRYYARIDKDKTIEAHYGEDVSAVPCLYLQEQFSDINQEAITSIYTWAVPEDYTILSVGTVRTTNVEEADENVLVLNNGKKEQKHDNPVSLFGDFNSIITTVGNKDKVIYIRGYLLCQDKDGNLVTIYTPITNPSVNSSYSSQQGLTSDGNGGYVMPYIEIPD